MRTLLPATIALVLLSTSCSKETAEEPPTGYDTVQLNYMNTPLPGITTAGQLTEEQFDALVQQGVKNIVSLRDAGEQGTGWEEARADAAGIRFVRIPVTGGPRGINLENATALDAALEASGGGETVVYCGSSNRGNGNGSRNSSVRSSWCNINCSRNSRLGNTKFCISSRSGCNTGNQLTHPRVDLF